MLPVINQSKLMSKSSNNADAMPLPSPHLFHQCSIQVSTACKMYKVSIMSCSIVVFVALTVILFRELLFPLVVCLLLV
jgi:archaellum biogenesis protein FlaJ (TadC family)